MPVLGNPDLRSLYSKLDPSSLVRLVRDVLVARGHKHVRITDGPGDSTRDIFSFTPKGKKHLAQCKYHRNSTHTCTNKEVSELPLGLIKHGYTTGLFVTNGGLTAPAKREYLDNYPTLELEFLDGQELFSEVLNNLMLRALWYDGRQVSSLASKLVYPLIIRMHKRDKPLAPLVLDSPALPLLEGVVAKELPKTDGLIITAGAKNHWNPTSFDPYRPPTVPTFDEGGLPMIMVLTLSLTGTVSLEDVEQVPCVIAKALASAVSTDIGASTVVVGKPTLVSNLGETEFHGASLPARLVRVVGDNGEAVDEEEWFYPSHNHWSTGCDARTGQERFVRLYHPSADVALSYRIRSPLTPEHRMGIELHKRSWNRCLYALVPTDTDLKIAAPDVPPPDDLIPWGEGIAPLPTQKYSLAAWYHSHYIRDGYCIEPRFDLCPDEQELEESIAEEDRRLDNIAHRLKHSQLCHLISPQDAWRLTQLGADDQAVGDTTEWNTASLITEDIESIPAPIEATGRIFECEVAWELEEPLPQFPDFAGNASDRVIIDSWNNFLVARIEFRYLNLTVSTSRVLDEVESRMHDAIRHIESLLPRPHRRATRRYWWRRYRVRLGLNYGDKDPADGSID